MNLQNMHIFRKVADCGQITHAAEELGLSQPTVTKMIQSLERELSLDLFERRGRRIVLTQAGRLLQSYAHQMEDLEREMEGALAALHAGGEGEVSFAANATAGTYLLPPIVARYRTHYPRVKLNISLRNSREIVEETLRRNLEFGIVEADLHTLPSELIVEEVAQNELVLVVAPVHRWSHMPSLPFAVLAERELVMREEGSGMREVIERAFAFHGVQLHPLFTLTDNEAIKQMVINGVGAAILSIHCVQRELAQGVLVRLPLPGPQLRPPFSLIRRADRQPSETAHLFCSFLRSKQALEY